MGYDIQTSKVTKYQGVELSTMMKTPCLRYKGDFIAMMFEKADALIIKVSAERVEELIRGGEGHEFNFTKKRFKEWVLIPSSLMQYYDSYIEEALIYSRRGK